ncbi:MAG: sigma-70 family RNA polymerase sigma factor [Sphingobacteriales bacterium]|nr:sigma-70 family RNA polymerase sigma factor [Sphingobacteriales bacterium]
MEAIRNFPDSELVANLRSGQRMDDSVKAIYRSHFDSLSWYVLNNSGSREDAEDVFQEVVVNFIDLVQKDKFRGESTVKTFLFSLNRHIWLNELKRRGRALAREEKFEKGQERIEADTGHVIADREARKQVMKVVEELGETCKKILLLFYYENLSMKDILETLHYENEQVVRNKKYKCLKQLEQMFNEKPYLKQTLKNLLHE